MGKKSRHSRSASWHPAWRADEDSSDSDNNDASVQPLHRPSLPLPSSSSSSSLSPSAATSSTIPHPAAAGQKKSSLLQRVAEESIDDRIAASQHQQAHSEPPHPPRSSSTTPSSITKTTSPTNAAAAYRERNSSRYQSAAVDTNSISSPVSLSPFASPNSSGFHVQSGALTFDDGQYTSHLAYEHYNGHEAENNLNNNDDNDDDKINNYDNDHDHNTNNNDGNNNNNNSNDHNNYNHNHSHDDDDYNDDYDGDFPDTIVIEDDDAPLSPPLGMSHASTEQYSYNATSQDTSAFSSSHTDSEPHAVHDQPRGMNAEGGARDHAHVMHFSRPFPRRADTARFFERDDIINRTQSFPMQPHSDAHDAGAGKFDDDDDGHDNSWPQTVVEDAVPEAKNESNNNEEAMDSHAYQQSESAPAIPAAAAEQSKANDAGDDGGSLFFEQLSAGQIQSEPATFQHYQDQFHSEPQPNSGHAAHAPGTAPPAETEVPSAPQIFHHDFAHHESQDATADASSNRDPKSLMVPDTTENEEYDSDMDDRLSTQSKPMYEPTENEVRFDEGIPLISGQQNDQHDQQNQQKKSGLTSSALKKHNRTISSIFAMDEPAEEEDFFKAVLTGGNDNGQSTNPRSSFPAALKRKSTSEVLGSMSFENGRESPIMEAIEEDAEAPAPSNEEENRTQTPVPEAREAPTEVKEEELAEKWKAMGFDDDELLGGEESILETPADASETPAGPVQQYDAPAAPEAVNDYFGPAADYNAQAAVYANTPAVAAPAAPAVPYAPPLSQTQPHRPALENRYAPHQPSTADLVSDIPGLTPTETVAALTPPAPAPQPQRGRENVKPPSFTESKERYRSPYDLPEDLTRQSRRQPHPVPPKVPGPVSYPPAQASAPPPLRKSNSHAEIAHATYRAPFRPSSQSPHPPPPPPPPKSQPPSNFYEELPAVAPRSRSRPRLQKAYSSTQQQQTIPPPIPKVPPVPAAVPPPPPVNNPYATSPAAQPGLPTSYPANSQPYGLQRPGPVDPYSFGGPSPPVPGPAVSQAKPSTRYSPKPPGFPAGTTPPVPAANKYSPAPGTAPPVNRYAAPPVPRESSLSPQPRTVLPFQPRTSSPLAASAEPAPEPLEFIDDAVPPPPPPPAGFPATYPPNLPRKSSGIIAGTSSIPPPPPPPQPPASVPSAGHFSPASSPPTSQRRYEPVESQQSKSVEPTVPVVHNPYAPSSASQVYAPPRAGSETTSPPPARTIGPPQVRPGLPSRSMTQPYASRPPAPTSHGSKRSLPRTTPEPPSMYSSGLSPEIQAPKPAAPELDFIAPTDGRELDPLQRWKGCPVIKFGFNGAIVSVFPKHVPRYASGHMVPRIMPTVGEIRVKRAKSFLPEKGEKSEFPGPLRGKQKKKDVVAWLSSMISSFEGADHASSLESPQERHERVLLWKLVRILVEHDGQICDNSAFETAVRSLLSSSEESPEAEVSHPVEPKVVRPEAAEGIKELLILGEREKAVWQAVDNNQWGHAMLLASTFENKTVWRQVVSEFIRKEILPLGGSGKSLAAAYEVFAGNVEESIDRLVPPSVRAGLQMVSKDSAAPGGNGFEGLEKWKETVQIILSNRTPNHHLALLSLSRLLASSGRIAAAHVCAILAAPAAHSAGQPLDVFGGVCDAPALIVLLGWDHRRRPSSVNEDTNAISLTEAYEFAISTLAGQPTRTLPHLQAFKLHHAMCLAERGQASEAQQYCEMLASTFKSTTNHSPYYNAIVLSSLDELMKRLAQSSADTGSSWISKPSMNKVSDSVWAKFSSFVAGEDSEPSDANGLAGQTPGPFSNVLGTMSTPSLANPSTDGSASYLPRPPSVPVGLGASRYTPAPSNPYAPQSPPSERSSSELQRPTNPYVASTNHRPSPYDRPPISNNDYHMPAHNKPYGLSLNMNTHLQAESTPSKAHTPLSPVAEMMVEAPAKTTAGLPSGPTQSFGSLNAGIVATSSVAPSPYGPTSESSAYQAPEENQGYVPPSYEPPSYTPPSYEPPSDANVVVDSQSGSDAEAPKPKKKSIMDLDDDDDILQAAENVKKEEKARHDREAAERIRKAAEEDAQRDAAKSQKKGWFSGWFGKKNNDDHGATVVRAKLGEESSFYYDKELKRWVNKKDPNSAKPAASAVPPPPKAPGPPRGSTPKAPTPSTQPASLRSSSASPLSAPPQVPGLTVSPPPVGAGPPPAARPPIQSRPSATSPPLAGSPLPATMPPPTGSAALTPPPKPPALSNASSIDDLLGAPVPRTHSGRSKKKGRGYVDIMAK